MSDSGSLSRMLSMLRQSHSLTEYFQCIDSMYSLESFWIAVYVLACGRCLVSVVAHRYIKWNQAHELICIACSGENTIHLLEHPDIPRDSWDWDH